MRAMIFCAGFGTRLRPLTQEIPKALVEVKGKSVLEWNIRHLSRHGVSQIVINTHYLHNKIDQFIKNASFDVPISIIHESEILGTGGGLFNARAELGQANFFVCNVDTLCTASISDFSRYHQRSGNLVTLATNNRPSDSMFLVDESSRLVGWRNKGKDILFLKHVGRVKSAGFAGWHMVNARIFDNVNDKIPFSIRDLYFDLIKRGITIGTWDIRDSYWVDIGTLEALSHANLEFPGFPVNL